MKDHNPSVVFKIKAAIKPERAYDWFIYTGVPHTIITSKGLIDLHTSDMFGVRKSSSGKDIRLVLDRLGVNKVYTINSTVAAYLAKNSRPRKMKILPYDPTRHLKKPAGFSSKITMIKAAIAEFAAVGTEVFIATDNEIDIQGAISIFIPTNKKLPATILHLGSKVPGVGTRLVKHVESFAKKLGIKRISLDAYGVTGADIFYEKIGYERNSPKSLLMFKDLSSVYTTRVGMKILAAAEYRYAMVNRPIGIGACPKDGLVRSEDRPPRNKPHYDMARNGVAIYSRELTDYETKQFEMAPMLDGKDLVEIVKRVTERLKRYAVAYIEMHDNGESDLTFEVRDLVKSTAKGYPPSVGDLDDFVSLVYEELKSMVKKNLSSVVASSTFKKMMKEYNKSSNVEFNFYIGADGLLKKISPMQFEKLHIKDETLDKTKSEYAEFLARKIKQFKYRVDYNSWFKKEPRTVEQQLEELKKYKGK